MKNDDKTTVRPNWNSAFWRLFYFIAGLLLLILGRLWMTGTDDTTMLPLLTMVAGMVLVTVAIRQWPRRWKL